MNFPGRLALEQSLPIMTSDGGSRAISGFLFQVLVGGALRAAGECKDHRNSDSAELAALVKLARTGQVVHEFADEDLMVRNLVVGPASAVSAEITLVQVKFSVLGAAKPIGPAELGEIIAAFAKATTRSEKAGERVTGYVLVTNRTISTSHPPLAGKAAIGIYAKLQRVENAAVSTWNDKLTRFARRFGRRADEIEAGRHQLLGLIFEAAVSGAAQGEITRDDLLRCLCGSENAQELTPERQASAIQRQLRGFDVDHRCKPVRRERMAMIDRDCAGRALVVFAGPGGSGKTAALHGWTAELAHTVSRPGVGPLVALRAAKGLPEEWLCEAVRDWNPAVRPVNADEALERIGIAGGSAVPLVHLALDGADEYRGDPAIDGRIRRLAEWFWQEDEAALAGGSLRARLVVTCRSAEQFERDCLLLRRSGGGLEGGRRPVVVTFDKFSETELRELLRANFPELERSLFRGETVEDSTLDSFAATDLGGATGGYVARHPIADTLLDPVMWRSFCVISPETRASLVAGNRRAEQELARHFFDRFLEKARVRTLIQERNLTTALASIASDNQAEGRRFRTMRQWQEPARSESGLSIPDARTLFSEAVSGGLIREEAGCRWDWRNDAVELHLVSLCVP